ncbi:sulfotransferase family protein [Nocardioides pocheonensis]|uniref:sulfotransferase family protein n=1 Tax=Nocardioides pocheonensis TaxID=661485 RepID=UPI001FE8CAA3|nr:sulfotransferase [Nocardioides pocheonensis]
MPRWPDFFIAGAPKAGTTALHSALVGVPGIALSSPKEPKFFLCDGSPPPRARHRGPGDAHSRQEWVWRESDYLRLWAGAPDEAVRGESTPFYLHDREAHRRIAAVAPHAKFVVLLRDPVDRAYSNWMHLWSDGLEPEPDFVRAVGLEASRLRRGWAPFWAYRGLGRYGEQLEHLFRHFDRAQVLVLRYRALVDQPDETVAAVLRFLGVPAGPAHLVPHDNTRPLRPDTLRTRSLARLVRAGAAAGAYAPPQVWRNVSRPLLRELHRKGTHRPDLTPEQRRLVLEPMLADLDVLERVTGQSFEDWRGESGRGSFTARVKEKAQSTSSVTKSWAPSGRASS